MMICLSQQTQYTVADFYAVEQDLRGLFEVDSALLEEKDASRSVILADAERIYAIDSLLYDGVSSQDSAAFTAEKDSLVTDMETATAFGDSLLNEITDSRATAATTVKSANSSITVTEDFEENLQTVYEIYLNAVIANSFDFSGGELEDLENIASQCFVCGGDGVFLARSLYSRTQPTWNYDDWELCDPNSLPLKGPKAKAETDFSFNIAPNPSSGWLIVTPVQSNDFEGEILLFNTQGTQVFFAPIEFNGNETQYFDIAILPSGLYTCAIYQKGKLIQGTTLSLIK